MESYKESTLRVILSKLYSNRDYLSKEDMDILKYLSEKAYFDPSPTLNQAHETSNLYKRP